ncbi:MAG: PAAR domain-containing protein [Rhizobiaceae bacterium]
MTGRPASVGILSKAMFLALTAFVAAEQPEQVITSGDAGIVVEGQSAAGSGDATNKGAVISGNSPNVFIGGKPAATISADSNCGGKVSTGASTVFVNGKPLATTGSNVSNCDN